VVNNALLYNIDGRVKCSVVALKLRLICITKFTILVYKRHIINIITMNFLIYFLRAFVTFVHILIIFSEIIICITWLNFKTQITSYFIYHTWRLGNVFRLHLLHYIISLLRISKSTRSSCKFYRVIWQSEYQTSNWNQ